MNVRSTLLSLLAAVCMAPSLQADDPLFKRASPGLRFTFPKDHGSHPEYQTEWWYYTGHLFTEGRKLFSTSSDYGFQLTFFRRAERLPQGGLSQFYFAHAALSDFRERKFSFEKRIGSSPLGLAGAHEGRLHVWNNEWRALSIGSRHLLEFDLLGGGGKKSLRLLATPASEPLLHGDVGFSKKGDCEECASHYYSIPGLLLEGDLEIGGVRQPLHGVAWMAHEFMSHALLPSQAGWDWFSLFFEDGGTLMLFQLRRKDGSQDFASGTYFKAGQRRPIKGSEFTLTPTEHWVSPHTQARYPSAFALAVPSLNIATTIRSRLPDQEIYPRDARKGEDEIAYWEGAVEGDGGKVIGYMELTGYAGSLGGVL